MQKSKLYWLCQFGGWGGLMMTSFVALTMMIPFLPALIANLVTIFLGVGLSHLYRYYVKKKDWKQLTIPKLVPRVLIASTIQGTVLSLLSFVVIVASLVIVAKTNPEIMDAAMGIPQVEGIDEEVMDKLREATMASFTGKKMLVLALSFISSFAIYFVCWSALYFAYQYLQRTREIEIEKWKLSASVKDAELSALKAQINPHFIFNSLNNIRSLVIEDSERARDSITHLSDLLRFSIQFDQFEKVSLEKEIEVVKDYLNLEAIQLEERLRYSVTVDTESAEIQIPLMIIQTLVENAIKHSINQLPNGGEIIIDSKRNNGFLNLYVKNTGQLKTKPSETRERRGIGIVNSKERLRLLYGEEATLKVENLNEHMVCATVRIPLN